MGVIRKMKQPPRRRRLYHGWSPQTMVLDTYLRFLSRIQQHRLDGHNKRTRVLKRQDSLALCCKRISTLQIRHDKAEAAKRFQSSRAERSCHKRKNLIAAKWRSRMFGPKACVTSILNIDGANFNVWDFSEPFLDRARYEFKVIRSKLHCRQRKQRCRRIKDKIALRLANFRSGKVRRVLTSLFQTHSDSATTVRLRDGTISKDPLQVHDAFTQSMDAWHSRNKAPIVDWERAIQEPGYLSSLESLQHIPSDLRAILEASMLKHSTNHDLFACMEEQFSAANPFTFDEFLGSICGKASGKSAGLSGFSINMLKLLNDDTKHKVFDALCLIWTTRNASDVPSSWHDRFMSLIPKDKTTVVTLEKVRPISLFETLRKVWTSMIMRRVQGVWNRFNILHQSQNAYRKGYAIEMELTQIINALESRGVEDMFLTSYDIEKAFDSVSRAFVIAAWMRLGVPRDIAHYLVELDAKGRTIIKSQHAQYVLEKYGMWASTLHPSTWSSVQAFLARDGFGQGDTPSAYGWDAVFDIQLVCLDAVVDFLFKRRRQLVAGTPSHLPATAPVGVQISSISLDKDSRHSIVQTADIQQAALPCESSICAASMSAPLIGVECVDSLGFLDTLPVLIDDVDVDENLEEDFREVGLCVDLPFAYSTQDRPITYLTKNQELTPVPPMGFADDLNILSPSFLHAQACAMIVSAFNVMAGLTTNFKKIRYGSGSTESEELIMWDADWHPVSIRAKMPLQA